MEHVRIDIVLRHRDRVHDLTLAVTGGAIAAADLIEALVPAAALAPSAGARRRHLRVGAATYEGDAVLDLQAVPDGVEVEVLDGPAPATSPRHWPEAGEPPAAARSGPTVVHRPPRAALPPGPAPVPLPEPPAPTGRRTPVLGLAALGPVLGAGLLVAVTGDARFAILAALSPLTGAFAALDQRRRSRGESRAEHRRFQRELAEAGGALAAAATAQRRRLEELAPPVACVARRDGWAPGVLWRRRGGDPAFPDHLVLRLGTGDVPWDPPVTSPARTSPEVRAAVAAASVLPAAPVTVDLGRGGLLGVVGNRTAALALVRSLLTQAAVHHGPADLRMAVCTREGAAHRWDWVKWLPHVRVPGRRDGRRLLAGGDAARPLLDELAASRGVAGAAHADLLVVLDDPVLAAGRTSPAAALLHADAPPVAAIVLAPTIGDLPASATEVVEVGPGGALLVHPQAGLRLPFRLEGIDEAVAAAVARRLARCRDPDATGPGDGLPRSVPLASLLGLEAVRPGAIAARWRARAGRLEVPIGVGPDGPVALDLVTDGPHALVAGTTGAGKSELLRSLVVGLAATVDPTVLTFVLVDYKGGAAFDACARLPHVVGLVTDLDPGLAERALRCLEAELRHRERTLRASACSSLDDHLAAGAPGGPLPRLVVVVDEFATMKQDVPGFVDSLVSIAQRGRSLGVHLVLATQRPGGAVSDDIRANTNLRVALRVQDAAESTDVVGTSGAARLPRDAPGRALVRRGPTEVVEVQTAWASSPQQAGRPPVWFEPLRFGTAGPERLRVAAPGGGSDLDRLVEAIVDAHRQSGGSPPRRPWVEPLPTVLPVAALGDATADGGLGLGWVDLPDEQRQAVAAWHPGLGHLLVLGSAGSGCTSALVAVAHAAARGSGPAACHLYAVDLGGGARLARLAALPHCGDVLGAADVERVVRLVRRLRSELERRRRLAAEGAGAAPPPRVLTLVDGLPALLALLPEVGPGGLGDLARLLADGPAAGIHLAATAERLGAVPTAVAAHLSRRLVLHLADPLDAAALGPAVARALRPVPGRAVDVATGLLVQVAWASDGAIDELAARAATPDGAEHAGAAAPIGVLPASVALDEVVHRSRASAGSLSLCFALGDEDLGPACLEVREGEHVLVAGPSRAGVSTALAALAAAGRAAGAEVVALVGPRSGLTPLLPDGVEGTPHSVVADALDRLAGDRATMVVVDDAHDLEDGAGLLAAVLADPPTGLVVVAGGRADLLRAAYGHWTRFVRRSRVGILLQPTPELDGELLGVRLPRSAATSQAGRGVLVEAGTATTVQVAVPAPADGAGAAL